LLPNGKVLVAGSLPETASAQLYDPATGAWTTTGSMEAARSNHTATLLLNGQVLVAGGKGIDDNTILASAELYDPATGVWTATGSMNGHRSEHTATLLPNGQVLVAGFATTPYRKIARAELYDPASGSWTTTAKLLPLRYRHAAALLPNGTVLVSGGYNPFPGVGVLALAELYKSAPEALGIE
jgi:N-acetylneuraminic acid mutarotase